MTDVKHTIPPLPEPDSTPVPVPLPIITPEPFADAKPGDRVYCVANGWGKVTETNCGSPQFFCVVSESNGCTNQYDRNGCLRGFRTLYWDVPTITEPERPQAVPDFKTGQVIAVRDKTEDAWRYCRFLRYHVTDRTVCVMRVTGSARPEYYQHWRELTPEEKGEAS